MSKTLIPLFIAGIFSISYFGMIYICLDYAYNKANNENLQKTGG